MIQVFVCFAEIRLITEDIADVVQDVGTKHFIVTRLEVLICFRVLPKNATKLDGFVFRRDQFAEGHSHLHVVHALESVIIDLLE